MSRSPEPSKHRSIPLTKAKVTVVGGGPAGSATALALLKNKAASVTLLHKPISKPFTIGESLAPNACQQLSFLEVHDSFKRLDSLICHGTYAKWFDGPPVYNDYMSKGLGYGWHLDRASFDNWLRQQAVEAGAELLGIRNINKLQKHNDAWNLSVTATVCAETDISSDILIDASGRKAAVATRLGAKKKVLDHLTAFALKLPSSMFSSSAAKAYSLVEATQFGWWYCAPVPNKHTVISFQTEADVGRELNLRNPEQFLSLYAANTLMPKIVDPDATGDIRRVETFAASTQFLDCCTGNNWMAVGDAALAMDPLTSSGIVSALDDGIYAAQAICKVLGKSSADPEFSDYRRRIDRARNIYLTQRNWFYKNSLMTRHFDKGQSSFSQNQVN